MTPPIQPFKNGLRYFRLRSHHEFFDPANTWHRLQKTKARHHSRTSRWIHNPHHAFKKPPSPRIAPSSLQRINMALPTASRFNTTIVPEQFKGHIRQRKSNNLLTKWEPRPRWKILPYEKFISSPNWPISFPQTSTTKVATICQQRSNLNTRYQTKPRNLVSPDLLQPSGYNMDQSDKCRFFSTWPGLTSKLITKHLPLSVNTALGHLRQQYQNTRSTKQI